MAAVGADCLRAGQTVVDVGIHVNEEGKLCGDVQFAAAEPVVDAITPVPGGVGTVTTSVLVGHVVQAACKKPEWNAEDHFKAEQARKVRRLSGLVLSQNIIPLMIAGAQRRRFRSCTPIRPDTLQSSAGLPS